MTDSYPPPGPASALPPSPGLPAGPGSDQPFHLVTFALGAEYYGVPIQSIQEIIRYQEICPLPNAPPHLEGLINLRGRILPVANLRRRMRIETMMEPDPHTQRVIVVGSGSALIGLIVDSVLEVLTVPPEIVEPPTALTTPDYADYVVGVAKLEDHRLLVILDLGKLLAPA
ncbi:MAG: purine-binding chemotaxis protein CheW [Nitrospirae bacterium]|nr:purine-binding chemotaxis protein CheW [Nitrospirota bacterium]